MIPPSRFETVLKKYRVHILVFLIAFFIISASTLPKVFLTDEWITVNQLSQLDNGHQFVINEGKYGAFENGTPFNYFVAKGNRLGYTIFLPLLALPVIKVIHFFGDFTHYLFLVLWITLLIVIGLFIRHFFSDVFMENTLSVSNGLVISASLLFCLNLVFFRPFPFLGSTMPAEVAAIGLTNIMLLSALAVILYATFLTIFNNPRISVTGTGITVCCSSYFFWVTTAKDHLLIAFLFSLLIYCGVKYLYTGERWYVPAFFIVIGLIAWARAELAVPLFGIFLLIAVLTGFYVLVKKSDQKTGLILLLSPLFTLAGAVPFFINNYLVTGNPLVPSFAFYETILIENGGEGAGLGTSIAAAAPPLASGTVLHQSGILSFIDRLVFYYSPDPGTSILDIARMFFLPSKFSTAIVVISPVLLLGIIFLVFSHFVDKTFSKREKYLVGFLGIVSVMVIIAYIHSWSGMPYSSGMRPDIRYLSPLYLPLGIMGIVLIQKCGMLPGLSKKEVTVIIVSSGSLIAALIAFSLFYNPLDLSTTRFLQVVTVMTTCFVYPLVVVCSLSFILMKDPTAKKEYCTLLLAAILILPFVWQAAMIFVSGIIYGSAGYTYWIPVVKVIMSHLQGFIIPS
jgi:hypothetical protein